MQRRRKIEMTKQTTRTALLAVLLAGALLAGGVAAYAGGAGEPAAPKEKPTLVFWQNEAGSGLSEWYKEVAADINAHENFQVKIVENPIANVIDLLTAAGVSQSGFDISWDWSGRMSTMLRGQGGVYQPVNGLVPDSVLKQLNQGTIVANTDENGKLWGVPVFNDTNYLVYNKEILQKAGVDLKKFTNSWEDFIAACEKVKKMGVVPISFANKEGIVHEFWLLDMMYQYFDNEKQLSDYFLKADFNEPKMKDAMAKYKYLYDKKYLDPAGETLDYASNYFSKFSTGQAAFEWFINSMYVSALKESQIGEDKIGYLPHVAFGKGALEKKIPGLGYCLTISAWTKYPKQAAKAIEYFVGEKWQSRMLEKYGVVPANMNVKVKDAASLPPNMKFYYGEHKGQVTLCPYEVMVGRQYDEAIRLNTPYFHGEITYEEFARKVSEATKVE
jgi:ABC-type glycerol-3-phosphate transport system substrate-binding protein